MSLTKKSRLSTKPLVKEEKKFSFSASLEQLLSVLSGRSRTILLARFGLSSQGKQQTLEEIGQFHKITRERVRQIIISALGFLSQEQKNPLFIEVKDRILSVLKEKDGIIQTEALLDTLAPSDKKEQGALLVFMECLSLIKKEKETNERKSVYVMDNFSFTQWKLVIDTVKAFLETSKQVLNEDTLYAYIQSKNIVTISKSEFIHFLSVAREIEQNVFGKWGLSEWSDIKPRGTREKAYLVLKMTGKPLHFREIASLIDSYGLRSRKKNESHPQTVHNELIKDDRFVLIGRGTYALSEWGYKKGTVKDVLEEILRTADKPLSREDVLTQILKVRHVKKSTVIINLNTHFHRVGKNLYSVKK